MNSSDHTAPNGKMTPNKAITHNSRYSRHLRRGPYENHDKRLGVRAQISTRDLQNMCQERDKQTGSLDDTNIQARNDSVSPGPPNGASYQAVNREYGFLERQLHLHAGSLSPRRTASSGCEWRRAPYIDGSCQRI